MLKNLLASASILALFAMPAHAQYIPGGGGTTGGGSGTVSNVATGACLTGGPITTTGTIAGTYTINSQIGTTYTIDATDACKLVTLSNGSAVAVTLPQATGSFAAGFAFDVQNKGAGTVTITPTTSTINGAASLALTQNQGCTIVSDGTNYQVSACTAVGGGAGAVSSVTGTANQITVSPTTGATVVSLPANVQTTTLALNGCTIGASALCTSGAAVFSANVSLGGTNTLIFTGRGVINSPGANTIYFGAVNGSSPAAQTLGFQSGNGTNINGVNSTITASFGTGTGTPGDLILQTGKAVGSGTSGSTATTALTVKGETQTVQVAGGGLQFTGTAPGVSSCGTGATVATGSTDAAGMVTTGTTASACTITFNVTRTNAPYCVITSGPQLVAFDYTEATTGFTVSQTATTGNKIRWFCPVR